MIYRNKIVAFCALFFILSISSSAQTDTTANDNEDYDAYGEVQYSGGSNKTYANAKIFGLSPAKFVTVGWDVQTPYKMQFTEIGSIGVDSTAEFVESAQANYTGGLRFNANIPIISTNRIIWQGGVNYIQTAYRIDDIQNKSTARQSVAASLNKNGLRTAGLFSTLYKPLNETQFLLFQGQMDLSGDYTFSRMQSLDYIRYSASVLWGKRPHDRKQWAVGISRTYRVGVMNYVPVLLFNYTSVSRKWGTEILFPARANFRYTFNTRSLVLLGYELEGQSYRLSDFSDADKSFEIRRGELRPRIDFQKQLTGFFWVSLQAGVRLNFSYDADYLTDGKEFFRGTFGNEPFAMKSDLGAAPYFNVSISFVSP